MKVLFLRKFKLLIVVVGVLFFTVFSVGGNVLNVGAVYFASGKKLPIYSVETSENKVAISFDAAWGADKTREIMSICESYNVKATFFLVGFWIEKYPEMVLEIYTRGF